MMVLEGKRERVRSEMERLKGLNERIGRRVGTILFEERAFVEAARNLFAEIRALDDEGADLIIAGALGEDDGLGFAVMNRMMKAAGYNVIRV
jgi:L-threonylcarbamoyladenylate synthase